VRPDLDELVHGRSPADKGPVLHLNVAGQLHRVDDNHVVADHAVVGHVHVSHQQAVFADDGGVPVQFRPAVERYEFADGGVVANDHRGRFPLVFEVLRGRRNDGSRENLAVFANAGPFHDHRVRAYPGAFADLNVLLNDGKRLNGHIGSDSCFGVDIR
jgi:hypothetical protein